MDLNLNDLKSTVSNLTLYDLKAGFRKAQNGRNRHLVYERTSLT